MYQFYSSLVELLSLQQWDKWQDHVFEDLSGKKILEVGVGPGKLLVRMAKKGYDVTGVEIRRGMAYEARRCAKQAGLTIDILQKSAYNLPFPDSTFDCVVLTFVLGEIADLDRAIGEIKRVLKKGGKAIVIAGSLPEDNNISARILFRIIDAGTKLHLERDNVAHFRQQGFRVTRKDFGPFHIINKIVAIKE